MTYVDLNSVRAGIANDLIDSDFTSIQQRIFDFVNNKSDVEIDLKAEQVDNNQEHISNIKLKKRNQKIIQTKIKKQQKTEQALQFEILPKAELKPLHGSVHIDITDAIPITFSDYLELVEITGRCIRNNKNGFIPNASLKIIYTLGLNLDQWLHYVKNFNYLYSSNVGSKEALKAKSERDNKYWYKGVGLISLGFG